VTGMAAPASRSRDQGGFTFVELMVVLAIMAFAFAYGIIHLDGATGSARLSSAARQFGTTIEFLRTQAIQSSRPLVLHVDLEKGQWTTEIPPLPSEAEQDRQAEEEVLVTEPVAFRPGIRFDGVQLDATDCQKSGEFVVTFSAMGEVTPNGFLVNLISDDTALTDEDAHFSIEVNGLTGEVTYTPGYAKFDQVVRGDAF
jgi:prepilin-type N-terminal cleavage/methylation domain-containing protein